MAESSNWVVTLAGGHDSGTVAAALHAEGFEVVQSLDAIGVLTGRSSSEVAEKARAIPGVADVSPETPIDIGPPDSPDTW